MLELLRMRDFALLWTGGLVSLAGDWVLYAALPYVVYARTGSTVATAGMIVAELAPSVVLGSFAGVIVDRFDRRAVLVAASLAQAVVVLALLAAEARLWLIYVVAAAVAAAGAFTAPAEGALLPALVGDDRLLRANALAALNNRVARVVGLTAGGALLGWLGLRAVVLVDASSFAVAGALIAAIGASPPRRPTSARVRSEWADGLRLVARDRGLAVLFVVLGLMTFGGTMLDPLTAAWVRDELGRGPAVFAWLMAVHGVFGIIGTVAVGSLSDRVSPTWLMGWSSVLAGAVLAVRFNVPIVGVAFALAAVGGVTSVLSSVAVQTVVQQSVADEYRGRVLGALGATAALLSLVGAAVGGTLGDVVGVVPALDVAAFLVAFSGLVVLRALRVR